MDGAREIELICQVDDLTTPGRASRRDFTVAERAKRAARSFGILFVIAFFTIFIPILHFILPPLILIAAGVFSFVTWLETGEVLDGETSCPNCRKAITLPRESEEWPKVQRCPGCSFTLSISPRVPVAN